MLIGNFSISSRTCGSSYSVMPDKSYYASWKLTVLKTDVEAVLSGKMSVKKIVYIEF